MLIEHIKKQKKTWDAQIFNLSQYKKVKTFAFDMI